MALYAGIDLHGNNGYYGIVDEDDHRVFQKRLPNELEVVLKALDGFKEELNGVAVESTYNWYWLVDGLKENGYRVHLANPAAIGQYNGLKDANDKTDALFLAQLLKLGILPEGYIYPKEERPVRDLLRRRGLLVRQRTQHILSFQSLIARQTGLKVTNNLVRKLKEGDVGDLLHDEYLILAGETNLCCIAFLTEQIRSLEKAALGEVQLRPEFECLLTVPGIGKILGLTIMLETGDIGRFPKAGNYSSYCRTVEAKRTSNSKAKGKNNRKNGNRYLAWAFVEAANFQKRYCEEAKSFYQRKALRTNNCIAIKALASKLSKACYYMIRDQVEFDVSKIFS